ncbi:MAG: hypothetical protein LBG65_08030 [Puniceicoccales bacterium]|jgi:hypothetical protein|nr:hypothetical protein [Puniceicoccales bacterium]
MSRQPTIFQRVCLVAILVAWVAGTGVQWDFLQVAAYARMIAGYTAAQNLTFAQAAEKALSGADPCALCKIVETGRHAAAGEDAAAGAIEGAPAASSKIPAKAPSWRQDDAGKIFLAPPASAGCALGDRGTFAAFRHDREGTPARVLVEVPVPPPKV